MVLQVMHLAKTLTQSKCFKDGIIIPITVIALITNTTPTTELVGRSCLDVCVWKGPQHDLQAEKLTLCGVCHGNVLQGVTSTDGAHNCHPN